MPQNSPYKLKNRVINSRSTPKHNNKQNQSPFDRIALNQIENNMQMETKFFKKKIYI